VTKRKNNLAEKMGGSSQGQPGWKNELRGAATTQEAQESPEKRKKSASYLRKTYLVSPELRDRIKAKAKAERVGQNELVRFLLTWGLDQLDAGDLDLPLEEVYRIKI